MSASRPPPAVYNPPELLLGGALALIGVLPMLPPTFNVELFHGTSLMTPDVMDAFLVYLPSSPAVEGTVAVVGDIVDSTAGVVKDIVDTFQNSEVLASSDLIWFSDMSFSGVDFGYYGYYGPDYFFNVDLLSIDTLGGVDMASGTDDLLALDTLFAFDETD
ncbi:hypothetical protein DAEQUDRAFT_34100 [Daedalea quercina L-15889]|uniref:Uncharacterized protein n=1 Tax=Daedalea quercina L-15889 TaxID=1314783 RepID=A0A165SRW7_9APHY|nr:hypothetical protein DAEQUDRAFT_34100 [Daedalea quercina L-15889]